jgi:hypothetical protein
LLSREIRQQKARQPVCGGGAPCEEDHFTCAKTTNMLEFVYTEKKGASQVAVHTLTNYS